MAKRITYEYDGTVYTTEYAVRQAVFAKTRKAFGKTMTDAAWSAIGVTKRVEEVADVVPTQPIKTAEELAKEAREKRDRLLEESDYYVMPDYPATASGLVAVKTYRQNLRDISKQDGFPSDIVWPTKPAVLGGDDAE